MAATVFEFLETEGKLSRELARYKPEEPKFRGRTRRPRNYVVAWKEGQAEVALIKCRYGVCILEKPGELPVNFAVYARVIERVVSRYGIEAVNFRRIEKVQGFTSVTEQKLLITAADELLRYIQKLREQGCGVKGNILYLVEGAEKPPESKKPEPGYILEYREAGITVHTRRKPQRKRWIPRLPHVRKHGLHRRKVVRAVKRQKERHGRILALQDRIAYMIYDEQVAVEHIIAILRRRGYQYSKDKVSRGIVRFYKGTRTIAVYRGNYAVIFENKKQVWRGNIFGLLERLHRLQK